MLEAQDSELLQVDGDTAARTLEVLRRRVDALGVTEPTLQRSDRRFSSSPGRTSPEAALGGDGREARFLDTRWRRGGDLRAPNLERKVKDMNPDVKEQELPGIGRRYELDGIEGGTAVVVIHHSGRRDLYLMGSGQHEPEAAVTLTDRQSRNLGAILGGAYFTPAVVEEMEAVIGDLLIDWVTVRTESPGSGRSIAELEIRRRTRMTVAAIARDGETLIAPDPSEILLAGDRLVVVGQREDLGGFIRHVVG